MGGARVRAREIFIPLCAHAHAFIVRSFARETLPLHGNSFVCHPLSSGLQEVT